MWSEMRKRNGMNYEGFFHFAKSLKTASIEYLQRAWIYIFIVCCYWYRIVQRNDAT